MPIVVHNCMISHGATSVMVDRLMESSDMFAMHGLQNMRTYVRARHPKTPCLVLKNLTAVSSDACEGVVQKNVPYAYKLLQQELL